MKGKVLLDTNIWVYLYAQNPPDKLVKVRDLVDNNFASIIVSTQVLGEFYNVITKKKLKLKDEAKQIILEMVTSFTIVEIDVLKVITALEINSTYGYTYWDSLYHFTKRAIFIISNFVGVQGLAPLRKSLFVSGTW